MNGLMEMMTANKWLIEPTFGLKAMRLLNAMAAGHLQDGHEKVYGVRCYEQADGTFAAYAGDSEEHGGENGITESFINVLHLEGPLTREGGACTYGSRKLRDIMMAAADEEACLGHLLLINGPGGVSNTIPDFLQATDYARSKGQPIVGRIDGLCASAHIWVSAMCDEVYYNNPSDQIGSVGIYWANILNKDGDIDPETGGKWHIVYDPASFDKNRFARDLAENDDDTLIKEELIADGEAFRNFIKARRPNVKDEHLHGKMFDVKDVEGILVDGQATIQEAMNRIVELKGKRDAAQREGNTLSTQINNVNMEEKFPALFAALQVEEMQMSEGGAFMNEGLLQTLNSNIEAMQKEKADAQALVKSLKAEKVELEQKLETANSEHTTAIETLKTEHATAIEEMQNTIADLEQEKADLIADRDAKVEQIETLNGERQTMQAHLDGAKSSLETAQNTIAERDQTISDLNAQIDELQNDPGEGAQDGSPANNGTGVETAEVAISTQYVMDPSKTYEENMKAKKEWEAAHK
ncbi:MAG: hypothetical protein IKR31_03225 [Prevotella sp.]|nr:hypothetical protein [Prevotella sp.]